ncbi:histidine kinase [Bizionia gelidisalsuginis]|uniref:Histidine kinase n=1 Tax=Bizionia gelidisalsuginis TaxID=291188 RepID=A0ABY3ME42_9FLAO|nr:histidine kinase [Bizionia gelidisalsuginis]
MNSHFKNIIITFAIGCLVFILGNLFFGDFNYKSSDAFLISFGFYQLYAFILAFSNMFYFAYLERLEWQKKNGVKRIIIGTLGSTLLTLIGLFLLRFFTSVIYVGNSFSYFISHESIMDYQFGLWITMSIVIVFHFVYFYNRKQKQKIKEQKVIAGTASAKFNALKNQLDPHFLFNSLNVLASLIDENPENAQKFTTSLSKIYRYVLEQKNKDLVLVDQELKFAKTYMSLLKMRFEDSLVFSMPEHAKNPESKVVPLSLQLLLENAVKHNIVTSNKPLHITIYEDNGLLVVQNNLQIKRVVKSNSSGVGLSNIKQRYALLTNKKISITESENTFKVALPMLTKQLSIMKTNYKINEQDAYYQAKKHVDEIKGFYGNLIAYCIIIPVIIFINYKTSWEQHKWFFYPMLGWGMGLIFHGFGVFGFGKNWEEKKIKEILDKEQHTKHWN